MALMRPPLRTAAFFTAVGLSLLVAIGAAALLAVFLTMPAMRERLAALPHHPWWFTYEDGPRAAAKGWNVASPLWSIAAALAAAVVALTAVVRLRARLARAPSPIALFLVVFLLSLCVEGLRAGAAYLAVTDRSVTTAVALSRAVYGGRFLGLLALLAVGLYCLEMKYSRYLLLAAGAVGIAFAMAVSIPVDRTVFLSQLVHKLGDEQSVWFVSLVLTILVVAAGTGAAFVRRNRRCLLPSMGTVLLLAGREILFFAIRPTVLAAGVLLLASGALLWLVGLPALTGEGSETKERKKS
jgi:hypothetical protein